MTQSSQDHEDLRKLLNACDELLDYYRERGKSEHPGAEQVSASRRRLEHRLGQAFSRDAGRGPRQDGA
jgi:hypothetical protein